MTSFWDKLLTTPSDWSKISELRHVHIIICAWFSQSIVTETLYSMSVGLSSFSFRILIHNYSSCRNQLKRFIITVMNRTFISHFFNFLSSSLWTDDVSSTCCTSSRFVHVAAGSQLLLRQPVNQSCVQKHLECVPTCTSHESFIKKPSPGLHKWYQMGSRIFCRRTIRRRTVRRKKLLVSVRLG